MAPERIVDEARESAYRFLEAQRDKSVTRGGTWEARELTRLFVHFWESGRNYEARTITPSALPSPRTGQCAPRRMPGRHPIPRHRRPDTRET